MIESVVTALPHRISIEPALQQDETTTTPSQFTQTPQSKHEKTVDNTKNTLFLRVAVMYSRDHSHQFSSVQFISSRTPKPATEPRPKHFGTRPSCWHMQPSKIPLCRCSYAMQRGRREGKYNPGRKNMRPSHAGGIIRSSFINRHRRKPSCPCLESRGR